MAVDRTGFYAACPGVVMTRDIEAALAALPATSSASAIQAAVLPLLPEGSAFQYTPGAPPAIGAAMPGATPVVAAALPPQPNVLLPVDGGTVASWGTVATFAAGMKRFSDSNPDPHDGWSIEWDDDDTPAGPVA